VAVNGIEVGTLPADMYNSIVKGVHADKRLYIVQAWNWLQAFFRFSATIVLQTCAMILMIAMGLAVFAPSFIADVFEGIQRADPAEFAAGLRTVVLLIWICSVFAGSLLILCTSYSFGAFNVFG